MIEKPTIIITSLGRTGTLFFSDLFREVIPDSTSLHEPDYFNFGQYRGPKERIREAIRQVRESGFYNLIIRKSLGKWNVRAVSDARVCGKLSYSDAASQILDQRRNFINSQKGSIYIESNSAFYGVIDVLPDVFNEHRVIYLVRDGRDWIRSMMNFTAVTMYGKGWLRTLISPDWPTATDLKDEPFATRWPSMSVFEKLCWAWTRLNEYALDSVRENQHARVFRFEDIFKGKDRYKHLQDLVTFAASHNKHSSEFSLDGWLERKIHGSNNHFPEWNGWSSSQKQQYKVICSPLMERLRYKFD
jgi:hypothetical protein